jgi:hypothetical protein
MKYKIEAEIEWEWNEGELREWLINKGFKDIQISKVHQSYDDFKGNWRC